MTTQDARERASGTERDAINAAVNEVMRAARSFGGPNRGVSGRDSEAWVERALRSYRDVIYSAVKREDEQRIAALVAALERAMQLLAYGNFKNGNTDPNGTLDEGEVLAGRMYEELRALAGIEERSSAG